MSNANAVPDGGRMLIPMLVCRDGASEVDFCKATFGAVELARRSVGARVERRQSRRYLGWSTIVPDVRIDVMTSFEGR